jgi:transposase InsO family protein
LICIDILSLEQSKRGYENILVKTDHFTRYAQAILSRSQTAQTTARCLWESFIQHYSFSARIHSDQGWNFQSTVIRELCKMAGIKKSRTTPYHPAGNGQCERFNSTLLDMLGTLNDEQKVNWKNYVAPLVHAYNATRHESTNYSPHFSMFGWHPRFGIGAFLGVDIELAQGKSRESYARQLEKRLQFAYKTASKAADKASRRHKTRYDLKVRNSVLKQGDRVLLKNIHIRGKQKLANRWNREPYLIDSQPDITIPVYVIRPEYVKGKLKSKTVHRNLLLPIYSLPTEELVHQIRKTVNPGKCKISDIIHNKEPIAKTVETKADHVSRNQLSYESDSDDDIVTHVVPTRHKISCKSH